MPELPEVETVRIGLEKDILNRKITRVAINRPDLRIPFPDNLTEILQDQTFTLAGRRGKYACLQFADQTLVIHLGMSGRVIILAKDDDRSANKHDHFEMDFEDGKRFILHDPRRFGMVFLTRTDALDQHKAFAAMGPEPLGNNFDGLYLYDKTRAKKTSIKTALLDQRLVAGLGNIYVCEALFMTGVHPERKAYSLSKTEAESLCQNIKKILLAAINAGGSTLKDYRKANGEMGYFQFNFSVYDKEGSPCPDCTCDINKTGGVEKIVQSGRSTYYCSTKQK